MIFVHDLQSSRILQQWFKFSSILQFLDIISSTNKLASNEHPWNLEIKHNIHKLSNTCSSVQWVVEPSERESHTIAWQYSAFHGRQWTTVNFNTLLRRQRMWKEGISGVDLLLIRKSTPSPPKTSSFISETKRESTHFILLKLRILFGLPISWTWDRRMKRIILKPSHRPSL